MKQVMCMRGGVVILMVLVWFAPIASAVTESERLAAIQRIQGYLLSQQDPLTGGWEKRYPPNSMHYGGETALVTYALLRSGLSAQDPKARAAIDYLKTVHMQGTYAISLRTHCWATLSNDYRPLLESDAHWLLGAQTDGLFDYGPRTGPRYDNSVTQYGLLGLWESSKRRGPTAPRVWQQSSQHFISTQNPDGGWSYQGSGASKPSMTAAGVTALLIAQENLYRSRHRPPKEITQAIDMGFIWLNAHASAHGVTVHDELYYLVSLERAALASGVRILGGHDWFQDGARSIIDTEAGRGNLNENLPDTAFALIFLARGGIPVWANKLQLLGRNWNNRPNDLNMLTHQLSDQLEVELGWQVLDVQSDTSLWLNAPVAYLASDGLLSLSNIEAANLETYLDLGGILVATPDADPEAFGQVIRDIAKRMYPNQEFKRAGEDHPLLGLVHPVDLPEDRRPWVLSNGVRDLIVLAPEDWGMPLQRQRGGLEHPIELVMANLHAQVTDRGRVGGELDALSIQRDEARPTAGTVRVVRAHIGPNKPLEPLSWYPLSNLLFNRCGLELKVAGIAIEDVDNAPAQLIHLGSAEPDRLSPQDLRRLAHFINHGGTVLIETIGGRGQHTEQLLKQFESVLGKKAAPLPIDHPIITGEGLGDARGIGFDMRRVSYRRFSTLNRGQVDSPRLMAINIDGRDAVFASHEDLSLGVLGLRHWGIDGYDIDSARGLVMNILLYVARQPVADADNDNAAPATKSTQTIAPQTTEP